MTRAPAGTGPRASRAVPARTGLTRTSRTVPARADRTVPARTGLTRIGLTGISLAGTGLTCAVVTSGCLGCGACLLTCPERAIRPAGPGGAVPLAVRAAQCTGCGECVEVCPADAIYLAQEVLTR